MNYSVLVEPTVPWPMITFYVLSLLADPGEVRGCSTNTDVIQWLTERVLQFLKCLLRRRHAQTV